MTKLEAAEVILKEKQILICSDCGGRGVIYSTGQVSNDCNKCDGVGLYYNERYADACNVLGIWHPLQSWSAIKG